jgi:hypothetical protein
MSLLREGILGWELIPQVEDKFVLSYLGQSKWKVLPIQYPT